MCTPQQKIQVFEKSGTFLNSISNSVLASSDLCDLTLLKYDMYGGASSRSWGLV